MKFVPLTLLFIFFSLMLQAQDENPYLSKDKDGRLVLTEAGASHFANLALTCLQQEYPNKLNQVLDNGSQLKSPKQLHPAFYGCFDWHSAVHGHWMLVRLLRTFPNLPEAPEIRATLAENLSAENIIGEVEYMETASKSWERMYGWSWLLKLAEELYSWKDKQGQEWSRNLEPLTQVFIDRYIKFLPIQEYPVRTGVHPNTAFGLSFALDYANTTGHKPLKEIIEKRAKYYFLNDENCPADWEPSGEDFLSACLEEANLMRRILNPEDFSKWFGKFLPEDQLFSLLKPAGVVDRSDPKIVHLDGLNLSRAWCFYGILPYIKDEKLKQKIYQAAKKHLEVTVPFIASEHYEGTHWLASFAVFALSGK